MNLLCDHCPAEAVAVAPGSEPDDCGLFRLSTGEARQQWCAEHWPCRPELHQERTEPQPKRRKRRAAA